MGNAQEAVRGDGAGYDGHRQRRDVERALPESRLRKGIDGVVVVFAVLLRRIGAALRERRVETKLVPLATRRLYAEEAGVVKPCIGAQIDRRASKGRIVAVGVRVLQVQW